MAAKKAAAKKTAAPQKPVEEVAVETQQTELLGEFPLPEGHYFHPPVVSQNAHTQHDALREVQRLIGAPQTGEFDDETVTAVLAWKQARNLGHSPVVDADTWQRLREG